MKIPDAAPPTGELLASLSGGQLHAALAAGRPVDGRGRYLHWDEMRRRTPPEGLTHEAWWLGTALARRAMARTLPILDAAGQPFRFSNVDRVQELVHRVDQQAGGHVLSGGEAVIGPRARDRYAVSSLIEEAITSSQLEGASTTRRVAREMLHSGRPPRDRGERMILNNFAVLEAAGELAASGRPLTPDGCRTPTTSASPSSGRTARCCTARPRRTACRAASNGSAPSPTARPARASCTPWCAPSCCTSRSATTTPSPTATGGRRAPSSTGRCCAPATGSHSTSRSRACCAARPRATRAPTSTPRPTTATSPTSCSTSSRRSRARWSRSATTSNASAGNSGGPNGCCATARASTTASTCSSATRCATPARASRSRPSRAATASPTPPPAPTCSGWRRRGCSAGSAPARSFVFRPCAGLEARLGAEA